MPEDVWLWSNGGHQINQSESSYHRCVHFLSIFFASLSGCGEKVRLFRACVHFSIEFCQIFNLWGQQRDAYWNKMIPGILWNWEFSWKLCGKGGKSPRNFAPLANVELRRWEKIWFVMKFIFAPLIGGLGRKCRCLKRGNFLQEFSLWFHWWLFRGI